MNPGKIRTCSGTTLHTSTVNNTSHKVSHNYVSTEYGYNMIM